MADKPGLVQKIRFCGEDIGACCEAPVEKVRLGKTEIDLSLLLRQAEVKPEVLPFTQQVTFPNADIEQGHLSSALCHLGNISYRLGKTVSFDHKLEQLKQNKQVAAAFETLTSNLEAVDVNLAGSQYMLGSQLTLDPKAEKFIGNDDANALLTREYRKPFVVPSEV